jgi:hypothetical protein
VFARFIGLSKPYLLYSCGAHALTLTLSLRREREEDLKNTP